MRHIANRDRAINIPVNCTVGPSGVPTTIFFSTHTITCPSGCRGSCHTSQVLTRPQRALQLPSIKMWCASPAGVVLVTFKSHTMSVPPYRIENQCADVHIYFVQACLAGERPGRWNWLPPRAGGSSMAYAWDEPTEEHRLRVKVPAHSLPSVMFFARCGPP